MKNSCLKSLVNSPLTHEFLMLKIYRSFEVCTNDTIDACLCSQITDIDSQKNSRVRSVPMWIRRSKNMLGFAAR